MEKNNKLEDHLEGDDPDQPADVVVVCEELLRQQQQQPADTDDVVKAQQRQQRSAVSTTTRMQEEEGDEKLPLFDASFDANRMDSSIMPVPWFTAIIVLVGSLYVTFQMINIGLNGFPEEGETASTIPPPVVVQLENNNEQQIMNEQKPFARQWSSFAANRALTTMTTTPPELFGISRSGELELL